MKNGNFKNDSGKGKGSGKSRNKKKKKSNKAAENQEASSIKWQVGDSCHAIFSEDGEIYEAVIISINSENETCAVKYNGYGNVEEQYLKDLVLPSINKGHKATKDVDKGYYTVGSPHHNRPVHSRTETETGMEWSSSQQTPHHSNDHWRVSDICLASEQPSGHWHEAVINSFPTPYTCQVTFLRSRKSQQVDKSQLYHSSAHHDHPPPPPPPHHHYSHGPPPHWHPHPNIPWPGRPPHVTSSYTSYSMFPPPPPRPGPTPPPPPPLSQLFMSPAFTPNINSHLPPPPPIPPVPPHPMTNASGQQDEALASMLMSWYLSGYYTGYYQGSHGSKQRSREKPPVQPDTTNTQESQQHAKQQTPIDNQKKTPSN